MMARVLGLFLWVAVLPAYAEPGSAVTYGPSWHQPGNPPAGQAQRDQEPTTSNQGNSGALATPIANGRPSPKDTAGNDPQQNNSKDSPDWWVAKFTGGLVAIGVAQALLFLWQLVLIRKGLADTKEAADAAKESADAATIALSVFERPWIFVTVEDWITQRGPLNQWSVTFKIKNHGRGPATIETCHIGTVVEDSAGSPGLPILEDQIHTVLGPGEHIEDASLAIPDGISVTPISNRRGTIEGSDDVFFRAQLEYRDVRGGCHGTEACWRFDRGLHRWVKLANPDYNWNS